MDIITIPLCAIVVFLVLNYLLNCVDEAVKFYDWRDEE